jgi:3-methyladenine DNA glycosylase AlkD
MSILSTFCYIKRGRFAETIRIARMLLRDGHDLMHKAVGWMLREVGKRDVRVLRGFLARHARAMPRTMLRYAIERFPEPERRAWLRSGV